jgi:predicted Zn-dependent protease with MMP-like domain/predicted negative regulator of RcsB-dependent stress response
VSDDPVERGWELLENGRVDEARKLADGAVTKDSESPEAHTLVGAVASAEGDVDAALEAFERAMELDPEYLDPILLAAETHALEGDTKEALGLIERALDVAEEEEEFVDALLLKAEIQLGDGDAEGAEKSLTELPPVALPSAALELRAGDAFLEIDDTDRAAAHYERGAKLEPDNADAVYGLGLVAEARGEAAEMVAQFQRVRALDAKTAPLPWAVTEDRMEELVEAALAELPERAQKLLENVPVMVEAFPSEEVVADGFDPRGLGLFAGVPFPEQSTLSAPPHLEAVFLYQRNIERVARSTAEVEAEIRTTLLHETGHFFGLDEEDLAELGLD